MSSTSDSKPIKILYVAFACEPGRGSEPGIGWNFVEEASKRRPVWVLTNSVHQKNMDAYLQSKHQYHPIYPIYVHLPLLGFLLTSFLGNNIFYYLWQFLAAREGRRAHEKENFELVHHVSYERFWMHSAGASIGPPFLFGPVGGGEFWPKSMMSELPWRNRVTGYLWNTIRTLMEHDPFLRKTLRRATGVIASVEAARRHLRRLGVEPIEVMITLLPNPTLPTQSSVQQPSIPFRFTSIGRLPRWKGVHLGIQAFAKAFGPNSPHPSNSAEYVIIGDGHDLPNLKKLACSLGVEKQVRFEGNLPYQQCVEHLLRSSAMIHPTLRDSAGLVYEALMLGIPVACVDVGMPAVLVNSSCGTVIESSGGSKYVVDSLASTMLRWFSDPDEYRRLQEGAKARTQLINREKRGNRLEAIYLEILGKPAPNPK
ncbi:MAG: glycosyltransferase [Pirellula sp.]